MACGEVFDGPPPEPASSWLGRRGARQWFVAQRERRIGPLTAQEVREGLAQGELTPGCWLWRPGLERWESLRQLDEFADLGEAWPAGAPAEIEGENTRVWHDGEQQELLGLVAEAELPSDFPERPTDAHSLASIFGEVDAATRPWSAVPRSVLSEAGELSSSSRSRSGASDAASSPSPVTLTAARRDSSVLFSLDEQGQSLAAAAAPQATSPGLPEAWPGDRPARAGARRGAEQEPRAAEIPWASFSPRQGSALPRTGLGRALTFAPLVLVLGLAAALLFYALRRGPNEGSAPAPAAQETPSRSAPLPSAERLARPLPPLAAAAPTTQAALRTEEPPPQPAVPASAPLRVRPRARMRVTMKASAPRHGRPWPVVLSRLGGVSSRPPASRSGARLPRLSSRTARPAAARAELRPLSTRQLAGGIDRARAALERCAGRHLQPTVVTLALRVDGSSGRVVHGRVLSILAGTALGVCALAAVREGARFPTFSGPPLELTWPIVLR